MTRVMPEENIHTRNDHGTTTTFGTPYNVLVMNAATSHHRASLVCIFALVLTKKKISKIKDVKLFPTRSSFIKRSSSLSKQTTMVFNRAHLETLWRAHLQRRRPSNGGERDDDALFAKYQILLDARDLDVETLRFVHEEKRCRFRPESLPIAVKRSNGTIEIVRYYAQHVPVEMLLEHEKMVKRATMFACQLGYFEVLKCLVETLRLRAPNVCPWSPWCLSMARRENHQACLNFCLENGCPVYHPNECHSRYIVGEPIRNGLPYYRKCARRREGGTSYCCKTHRYCCACAGYGRVMETVKTALGSFQKKKPCVACRSRGVVLPLEDDDDESNDSNTQEDR